MNDLYKTIRENQNGRYLIIHANYFNEAIDLVLENKLEQIQIRGVLGKDNDYYHSDHLGNTSLITNLDGDVVQHIGYLPFGDTRPHRCRCINHILQG